MSTPLDTERLIVIVILFTFINVVACGMWVLNSRNVLSNGGTRFVLVGFEPQTMQYAEGGKPETMYVPIYKPAGPMEVTSK